MPLSPFHIPSKKLLIPFQTDSNTFLTFFHSSPQFPSNSFMSTPNIENIARKGASRLFITPVNIDLIPSKKVVQSPFLKPSIKPTITSIIPETMSIIAPSCVPMPFTIPVINGSRKLQKPTHAAFITSVISLKLNPSLFTASVIFPNALSRCFFIPSHTPFIFSRKSSFVFQRVTNAATKMPMTAMTASTGADIPPMAETSPAIGPCPALVKFMISVIFAPNLA